MGNQPNTESDPVEERLRNQIEEEKRKYVFILQMLFFKHMIQPNALLCYKNNASMWYQCIYH